MYNSIKIYKLITYDLQKTLAAFTSFGRRNYHLVKFERSGLEAHTDGLFLADRIPASDLAKLTDGEIAHLHTGKEHSAHIILHPADCKLYSTSFAA